MLKLFIIFAVIVSLWLVAKIIRKVANRRAPKREIARLERQLSPKVIDDLKGQAEVERGDRIKKRLKELYLDR